MLVYGFYDILVTRMRKQIGENEGHWLRSLIFEKYQTNEYEMTLDCHGKFSLGNRIFYLFTNSFLFFSLHYYCCPRRLYGHCLYINKYYLLFFVFSICLSGVPCLSGLKEQEKKVLAPTGAILLFFVFWYENLWLVNKKRRRKLF